MQAFWTVAGPTATASGGRTVKAGSLRYAASSSDGTIPGYHCRSDQGGIPGRRRAGPGTPGCYPVTSRTALFAGTVTITLVPVTVSVCGCG